MSHVLIIDDEPAFRNMLKAALSEAGHLVSTASGGEAGLDMIARELPGLVLLDQRMGPRAMSGIDTLKMIRSRFGDLPVVMVTAFGDVQTAVQAMKIGALDFLEKPIDLRDLRRMVQQVLDPEAPSAAETRPRLAFGGIVPATEEMQSALDMLAAAAESDAPVLIYGESGTGKELAAAFLHERGRRANRPLVTVNCAAIPSGLLEAEMFGCEAGAFTGATRTREGRFAAAEGGTLLLDEIAEMDVLLQAKLLRVLQEREYQALGSNRTRKADVRIIASTNRSIPDAIEQGAFREDLCFRINVFEARLPPLRERRPDILPLAKLFLEEFGDDRPRRLSSEAESLLWAHHWPGNIRELRNTMERASIMGRGGVIRAEHLPPTMRAQDTPAISPPRPGTSVREMEQALIVETLALTGGNRTRAAERLGMSRRALLYKIKRYGITQ